MIKSASSDKISSNVSNNSRNNSSKYSGRIQIQIWYNDEKHELVVAILAADDLMTRDDSLNLGYLPEAYATLRLIPITSDYHTFQTSVAPAGRNPIWNSNFIFQDVPGDELMEKHLEVTLWDLCPHYQPVFLGGCIIDLKTAFFDDRTVWYRLSDLCQLRIKKSPYSSPRGSIGCSEVSLVKLRKNNLTRMKSYSNDSIGEAYSLLHPDKAFEISNSRRGSSQSEYLETDIYQLNNCLSRSLPGSRRSSFQSLNEDDIVIKNYTRDRRRSSASRTYRNPEDILRSLKEVKVELNRTLSPSNSISYQTECDDKSITEVYNLSNFKTRRSSCQKKKK